VFTHVVPFGVWLPGQHSDADVQAPSNWTLHPPPLALLPLELELLLLVEDVPLHAVPQVVSTQLKALWYSCTPAALPWETQVDMHDSLPLHAETQSTTVVQATSFQHSRSCVQQLAWVQSSQAPTNPKPQASLPQPAGSHVVLFTMQSSPVAQLQLGGLHSVLCGPARHVRPEGHALVASHACPHPGTAPPLLELAVVPVPPVLVVGSTQVPYEQMRVPLQSASLSQPALEAPPCPVPLAEEHAKIELSHATPTVDRP